MKFLIVGLGNVGVEYSHTRHNIGFDILDALAGKYEENFIIERLAHYAKLRIRGKQIHCIKPSTYMNLSGKALSYWMNKLSIDLNNVLVITDDLALPLCKLRLRTKGSDAGHNGLKNINEVLNTNEYCRLRFGIGSDFQPGQQINYVLGNWNEEENILLKQGIEKAVGAIELFVNEGPERSMNKINQNS